MIALDTLFKFTLVWVSLIKQLHHSWRLFSSHVTKKKEVPELLLQKLFVL